MHQQTQQQQQQQPSEEDLFWNPEASKPPRRTPFYRLWWRWMVLRWQRWRTWLDERLITGNPYDEEIRLVWRLALLAKRLSERYWRLVSGSLAALFTCFVLFLWLTSDAEAQVQDASRNLVPHFARDTDPGVDFGRQSRNLTCAEQQSGFITNGTMTLSKLIHFSETALRGEIDRDIPPLPCACAPLFGVSVQLLSIRLLDEGPSNGADEGSTFVHAFRPRLEPVPGTPQAIVVENQDFLFGEERARGSVRVKRHTNLVLHYTEGTSCRQATPIQLKDQWAFCAQACAELMQGLTVDRSPNALPQFANTI